MIMPCLSLQKYTGCDDCDGIQLRDGFYKIDTKSRYFYVNSISATKYF